MTGFVEFHLLKGPEARRPYALFLSHRLAEQGGFEAWTKSEQFRRAHQSAGNDAMPPLYIEHPKFEGFQVKQTLDRHGKAA